MCGTAGAASASAAPKEAGEETIVWPLQRLWCTGKSFHFLCCDREKEILWLGFRSPTGRCVDVYTRLGDHCCFVEREKTRELCTADSSCYRLLLINWIAIESSRAEYIVSGKGTWWCSASSTPLPLPLAPATTLNEIKRGALHQWQSFPSLHNLILMERGRGWSDWRKRNLNAAPSWLTLSAGRQEDWQTDGTVVHPVSTPFITLCYAIYDMRQHAGGGGGKRRKMSSTYFVFQLRRQSPSRTSVQLM